MKPVQVTKIHFVDSTSVNYNLKQRIVLPTERVTVYFLPKSYIAKLSIYHYKKFHISSLVCVLCDGKVSLLAKTEQILELRHKELLQLQMHALEAICVNIS